MVVLCDFHLIPSWTNGLPCEQGNCSTGRKFGGKSWGNDLPINREGNPEKGGELVQMPIAYCHRAYHGQAGKRRKAVSAWMSLRLHVDQPFLETQIEQATRCCRRLQSFVMAHRALYPRAAKVLGVAKLAEIASGQEFGDL
jgi:hypothetical protein